MQIYNSGNSEEYDFMQGEIDMGACERETDISPLLVGLYDAHKEYAQHSDKDPQYREIVCQQMTDLLAVSSHVSDREMITDVLITLLRQSEKDLKAAMAERLSLLSNVPLRILLQLLNEEISIARPIIKNSPVLNDLDLLYIIQSRDTTFWQAIAARHAIKENVVDALAETHDVPTAKVLVRNETISFSDFALSVLEEMAANDEDLARPLLMRSDVPQSVARKIYAHVGQEIKALAALKCGVTMSQEDAAAVQNVLHDVVSEFSAEYRGGSPYMPTEAMLRAADMFMKQGKLDCVLMVRTLGRGQISSFVAQMCAFAKLNTDVVISLLEQSNGQGLAIIAKANGISKNDFLSMFMMTRRIISGQANIPAQDISKANLYFDRVHKNLAQKILKRSQH
ncbi:MAG: DUF2336 domain-containing protein [Alphaproteobacteria bacterium]|nr:DUF2336 domain-containing protein [Alphaproteobacteria bacterium]